MDEKAQFSILFIKNYIKKNQDFLNSIDGKIKLGIIKINVLFFLFLNQVNYMRDNNNEIQQLKAQSEYTFILFH